MPYLMEECEAGRTVEVCKYYSARYGKRGPRGQNKAPTSEAVQVINRRQAEKKLRRLMNANFRDDVDALVTLDFSRENRPGSYEEMKRLMQNFLQKLRRRYKKAGIPCRYIWVAEIGQKGCVHVHMLLGDIDVIKSAELRKMWGWGSTDIKNLWSGGQYAKIASYFLKYSEKTEKTTGEHLGRKWNPSKGLKQPRIRKVVVMRSSFRVPPKARKGYHLEKDKEGNTYRAGVSELTGLPYMQYTMVRD